MAKGHFPVVTFNAGIVSSQALGRVDVARLKFAAETQTNWVPMVLGPMYLRTGLEYIDETTSDLLNYPIPFVYSADDYAIVELDTNTTMRVRVSDTLISRASVSTAITSSDFSAATGWTLTNTGGATSSISGGYLTLSAVALGSLATCEQSVSVSAGDQNTEHGLRIVVTRGPVGFRIGTSSGDDDVFSHTTLGTGTHSLAFTPGATTVYIRFEGSVRRSVIVDSCTIESSGTMTITAPWASSDLPNLSWTQSGDIIYIACYGYQQRKIERRSTNSWSLVLYQPEDGPFAVTASDNLTITPSDIKGNITLTAGADFFTSSQVGMLLRLFESSQDISENVGAADTFTDPIRVSGVGGARSFTITISGTWSGTITLQRSVDAADSGYTDVGTYSNTTVSINDGFDNSICWYRLGFKAGEYTSGTATCALTYPNGGDAGVVRITAVSSLTSASAEVLNTLSSTSATRDWQEGDWSDKYGWPSAVTLYEGRMWWFGQDSIWGSVSDAYESFDIEMVGDAAPIDRTIGYGPVEVINWALPLQRLIVGLQSSEASIRSSSFDAPLTPTNFSIKDCSTEGSAQVPPVKVDTRGIFVQRSKRRVYQLLYDLAQQDYLTSDLTALIPDIDSNLTQVVVQRQPDTRLHFLRADGKVMVLVFEAAEKVTCWYEVTIDGTVERMVVMPGDIEDRVYYYVKRTINGADVRFVEKFSLISECTGGTLNKQADSFSSISQSSSTTISGLSRLEGESVVVWANGKDLGSYTVSSGAITVSEAVTTAIVGLSYTAQFKSAKLAYGAQLGTALSQVKRIDSVGLILHNTHYQGLQYGQDFTKMDNLPLTKAAATVSADTVYSDYDTPMFTLDGKWDTDSRLCLQATAPKPCTVLAATVGLVTHDDT